MMTILEALEAKHGHLHTVADWRITREKSAADLTNLDLAIIGHFDGQTAAAAARDARVKALLPPPVLETTPAVSVATPAGSVARLPTLDDADDISTIAGLNAWAERNALAATLVAIWHSFVTAAREKREQLEAEVGALRARLSALEAKPHVKFTGVWKAGSPYQPGDAATHAGGLWICSRPTSGEPGKDFVGWTLAVKRGSVR